MEAPRQCLLECEPDIGVFVCVFDGRGRVLCVRRNYGPRNWTTPGGQAERDELPQEAAQREAFEETGFVISVGDFIGSYFVPSRNNLVLSYLAHVVAISFWQPNDEIAERSFFDVRSLPNCLSAQARLRIEDARMRRKGVFRICAKV